MKSSLSNVVTRVGVQFASSREEENDIILTNQISLLLSILPLIYIGANVYNQGWTRITLPILIQPVFFLSPILFNYFGFIVFSRIVISWIMPLQAMAFSIYNKSLGIDHETSHYLGIRFSILASAVIPFLVFRLKNSFLIVLSLSLTVTSLIWFDEIHNFFNVGYYQVGLRENGYSLTTMRVMIAFLLIAGSSLFLKRRVERNEAMNLDLISELTDKNNESLLQVEEISSQHEQISEQNEQLQNQYSEIVKQRDQLNQNEGRLSKALQTIKTQQEVLLNQNKSLEFEILERNKELHHANQELIQNNNELQQFSHAVSHNLRGPVATILGLMQLLELEGLESNPPVLNNLVLSVKKLDTIIHDLNRILEIRNETFQIKEYLDVPSLVAEVKKSFSKDIQQYNVSLKEIYQVNTLVSIHTFLNNILYNLISNAIKFRSPARRSEILISTTPIDNYTMILIRDNGMGLDLILNREKLFKLYARFNTVTEGKGMGLFLIKLQVEKLGGYIEVSSEPDFFTEFRIFLPTS